METFLVRIWQPAEPDAPNDGEVRGFVQRARDGREEPFVGVGQLLELLAIKASSDTPIGDGVSAIRRRS
jgi:hypothetical protein